MNRRDVPLQLADIGVVYHVGTSMCLDDHTHDLDRCFFMR